MARLIYICDLGLLIFWDLTKFVRERLHVKLLEYT